MDSTPSPHGSGKSVTDYTSFCEGDTEPSLNKKIHTLIDRTKDYIIYLDDGFYVWWKFPDTSHDGFARIANKIAELETLSITQLAHVQREPFGRFLGEAMARVIGDKDSDEAEAALTKAQAYLNARGMENARRWYLQGVGWAAIVALLMSVVLLLLRKLAKPGWLECDEILAGAMLGSLGALLSIASRTEAINIDAVAGPKIHQFEGAVRVVVGIAGAFVIALAIKADLLFGTSHSWRYPFVALALSCIAAGASERLAPGIIKNIEKSTPVHPKAVVAQDVTR